MPPVVYLLVYPQKRHLSITGFTPIKSLLIDGGYVLLDNIRYGINDKVLVAFENLDGILYNARWCIIHSDAKTGRNYINIHRRRYWLDDFMRV